MATIKDVAKHAGVSTATVSRVVNNSPKASKKSVEAVKLSMHKLGYRPNANARALVSKNTHTIGVLVGDISDPFFGSMIKSIDTVARKNNKQVLIGNGYHNAVDERAAIELLINSQCESLIIHSKALTDNELLCFAREVPGMVIINRVIPEIADRCIALDNFTGTYLATDFLIRSGHKEIAWISSNHHIEDSDQRKQGYLKALSEHQLTARPEYFEFEQPNVKGGERAMNNLLSKNVKFTAVVAYNDYMAAGALSTLDDNNIKVPDKISIIGFDDALVAQLIQPKLTTIRYPIMLMAEQAIKLSLNIVNGNNSDNKPLNLFKATLIKRLSVKSIC